MLNAADAPAAAEVAVRADEQFWNSRAKSSQARCSADECVRQPCAAMSRNENDVQRMLRGTLKQRTESSSCLILAGRQQLLGRRRGGLGLLLGSLLGSLPSCVM